MAITSYENKQLRLNTPLRGHPAGTTVRIQCDGQGVPVDRYWRNRLNDAKIDNCVEIVEKKKGGKSK